MTRQRIAFTTAQWIDVWLLTICSVVVAVLVFTIGRHHPGLNPILVLPMTAMIIKVSVWLVPLSLRSRGDDT